MSEHFWFLSYSESLGSLKGSADDVTIYVNFLFKNFMILPIGF